ncbi:cell division protein ZapA [Atopomonas sediminilitoris]|uniref:cell division protein ZapA n=1 Tax=Atopomonas sediminilitoris TaxID=2919919 RepID=UPI001F4DC3A4|nr:cell division protein ZapA [Atopomonas sediminilitoris]MCJ8168272.1 cell division protein ZapA [Atopomonas sediminilitoris]
MKPSNDNVTLHILDKEYTVACPENERDNLQRAGQYLDARMRQIRGTGKVIGADRIAVMAALNISHELLLERAQLELENQGRQKQLSLMLDKLETALARHDD